MIGFIPSKRHQAELRKNSVPRNLTDLSKSGLLALLPNELANDDKCTVKLAKELLELLANYDDDDDPVKLLTSINPSIHNHPNRRLIIRRITEFLPEKQRLLWQRIHDNRELEEELLI